MTGSLTLTLLSPDRAKIYYDKSSHNTILSYKSCFAWEALLSNEKQSNTAQYRVGVWEIRTPLYAHQMYGHPALLSTVARLQIFFKPVVTPLPDAVVLQDVYWRRLRVGCASDT